MAVDAVLELDVSGALTAVDSISTRFDEIAAGFGTAITDAMSNLSTGDVALGNIDTSGITTAIEDAIAAANTDIIINADASAVTAEIDSAISGVDTQLPPIQIDTSDAVSSLEDLGGAAQDATGDIGDSGGGGGKGGSGGGGLSGAVQTLGASSDIAGGSLEGATKAAGSLGPEATAGAAGATILGGTLYSLFDAGVKATGAEEQFSTATGYMGQQIIQMQGIIPGFNGSLLDLGAKLGTSSTAMYQSTSAIYQQGLSAGQTQTTMATYSDRIAALAANAVAMNPKLGDVDQVMNRLNLRIGTGGNFLSKYGISLDKNQIRMHAWEMGLQDGNGAISSYSLKVAAADMATQQLGPSMKKHIEDGSKNAATQLKVLKTNFEEALAKAGQPLVSPMMNLMKEGMPVAIEFSKLFAELGKAILPALMPVLHSLTEILKPMIATLKILEPVLKPVFMLMMLPVAGPIMLLAKALELLSDWGLTTAQVLPKLIDFFSKFADAGSALLGIWEVVASFFADLGGTLQDLLSGVGSWLSDAGHSLIDGFVNGIETAASAIWDWFTGMPLKILTAIAALPTMLTTAAIAAVTAYVSALTGIITAAVNIVSSMVSSVIGVVSSIIGALANIASTAVSTYIGALTAIIGLAVSVISGMVSGVIDAATAVIGLISDVASRAADGFINGLNAIKDVVAMVAGVVGDIVGAIAGLVSDFANMASTAADALIHGIVNGIKSGAGAIGSAIKDMATSAFDNVKSAFGFGSPSRIMHEYGELFVEGFTNGIAKATPTVPTAMSGMVAAMQPVGDIVAGSGILGGTVQQNPNVVRVTEQSQIHILVVRDWAEAQSQIPGLDRVDPSFVMGRR